MARTKQTARKGQYNIVRAPITNGALMKQESESDLEPPVKRGRPTRPSAVHQETSSSDLSLTVQDSKLYEMFTDKKYFDVLIIASDGTELPSFRCVLAKHSAHFTRIFEESNELPIRIPMNDFDAGTIQAALDFMLDKPFSVAGKDVTLLKFAANYDIPGLKKAWSDSANKITPTNSDVIEYINFAYTHNLKELKQKCLKVLFENRKNVDKALLDGLPKNILTDLLLC